MDVATATIVKHLFKHLAHGEVWAVYNFLKCSFTQCTTWPMTSWELNKDGFPFSVPACFSFFVWAFQALHPEELCLGDWRVELRTVALSHNCRWSILIPLCNWQSAGPVPAFLEASIRGSGLPPPYPASGGSSCLGVIWTIVSIVMIWYIFSGLKDFEKGCLITIVHLIEIGPVLKLLIMRSLKL